MPKDERRRARLAGKLPRICATMTALCGPAIAGPERPRPEAVCAAYDLHFVTLIEDHGRGDSMSGPRLAAAMMGMAGARVACRAGDVGRALRLYGAVDLDPPRIGPADWVLLR